MKTKVIIAFIALMMASAIASAQTSLKGRVYYHPNIMEQAMGPEVDIDKKIAEARANAIAKKEKEKGRKLTKEEIAKLDKETANARKQAEVLKKALTVAITVEFTSATDVIMSQKTKIDDDALKKMGVGWFKRKALKAALALSPESQKEKYEVKGNKVFFIDGKDRDTLTLSNDGKTLSGELDKDTKFTLKRTK
jgi:hypothetical protein